MNRKLKDNTAIIEAIESSRTKTEACSKLNVSRQGLDYWLKVNNLVVIKDVRLKVENEKP